jgi:hypothetical protein
MVDGVARLIEPPKGQAKLGVVFPSNPFSRPVPADGNYWVLDTDYINYSIVWTCQNFNDKSIRKHSPFLKKKNKFIFTSHSTICLIYPFVDIIFPFPLGIFFFFIIFLYSFD